MKRIPLRNRQGAVRAYAIVDDEDYGYLNQWKWSACKGRNTFYVKRTGKNKETISMHILVMQTPRGLYTDHINHNGLDNRRSNLRIVTNRENQMNRRGLKSSNKSGVHGVCSHLGGWRAQSKVNGKDIWLGWFKTKIEAARAYDNFMKSL